MIIDSSYFIGEIYLSQVGEGASKHVNDEDELQVFIDEYEPDILKKALGRKLYDAFDAELNADGTIKGTADPKWGRLLNGHTYTKDGIDHYWRGITEKHGKYRKSFIAYYVYYHYVKDDVTQTTTQGTVKSQAENASPATAVPKLTNAWRKFHEWYYGNSDNVTGKAYWDRGVYVEDYFTGTQNTKEVSLYEFLTDNKTDYDDWYFTNVGNENSFGL